jgi:hypothetical protein
VQTIGDAMERDTTRVTTKLNPFFGRPTLPAIVGDMEGDFLIKFKSELISGFFLHVFGVGPIWVPLCLFQYQCYV